ncbi:STAS domain-containing protein [Streptacidiphilus carbonis]|jgi:anti-anti-sigma factor|uniref:STAS domain-containing protein n=1 Tax=Streptacidiphilus carbonis TaxID=105422 RepID=UPI0005AAC034|nr:STAS domain-containing protein [Streptacidiphilus carbonis]
MHEQHAAALVQARGEIDLDTAPALQRRLTAALKAHGEAVLDLSQVTFMDCAGLRPLLLAHHLAARHGGRLILHGACHPVLRLLELTGLDQYLTLGWPPDAEERPL